MLEPPIKRVLDSAMGSAAKKVVNVTRPSFGCKQAVSCACDQDAVCQGLRGSFLSAVIVKGYLVSLLYHAQHFAIAVGDGLVAYNGGINAGNIGSVSAAGADTFVSASSIFNHPDGIGNGVAALRQILR